MRDGALIRRIVMILAFYGINFGLWEVLVLFTSEAWASFGVYVVLLAVTFALLGKQLAGEWRKFVAGLRGDRRFILDFVLFLLAYFLLGGLALFIAAQLGVDIAPQNNENVRSQLQAIPAFLTVFQVCVFAPIIEEMTFRYSIIGDVQKRGRWSLLVLSTVSVLLFDAIHIVSLPEFFYYLAPAVVLTAFYVRRRNVVASMLLHTAANVVGTVVLLLQ